MGHLTLVLGGASSGKSAYAEALAATAARAAGAGVVYLATGAAGDHEMRARIDRHRARRPAEWRTIETADLAPSALAAIDPRALLVVDSLTAHLTHALLADETALVAAYDQGGPDALAPALAPTRELLAYAARRAGATVVIGDELGQGIVPATALGRAFRDLVGLANQLTAQAAARAVLVVAGRPLELGVSS